MPDPNFAHIVQMIYKSYTHVQTGKCCLGAVETERLPVVLQQNFLGMQCCVDSRSSLVTLCTGIFSVV